MTASSVVLASIAGAVSIVLGAGLLAAVRGIHRIYERLDRIEQVLKIPNGWKVPQR